VMTSLLPTSVGVDGFGTLSITDYVKSLQQTEHTFGVTSAQSRSCVLRHSLSFMQWTVRLDKFHALYVSSSGI
jgi:hypothetical protein